MKDAPVETEGVVFVNREKLERAKDIVALVSGARVPKNEQEAERKEHYTAKFAEAEQNPKSKDALQFAYELLGGLVRTPEEQSEADAGKVAAQKRNKKKAVQE